MILHIPTLVTVTVFVFAILGALLLATWLQDRGMRSLLWWGGAFLLLSCGQLLLGLRGAVPDWMSIAGANALLLTSGAFIFVGSRIFEGRKTYLRYVLLPPVIWVVCCQIPLFANDMKLRIVLFSVMVAPYLFGSAYTFWLGRKEPLVSRWTMIVVLAAHGFVHSFRIVLAYVLPLPADSQIISSVYFGAMTTGLLFFQITFAFGLLALTKERAELGYKRAASTDPLTGLLNRRALFDAASDGRLGDAAPMASMLVFDLDRFKQINDRFGHPVGDRVLQLFARTARTELRPCDLVGRLGGEEFAAILPDCDSADALRAGERVRAAFAAAARKLAIGDLSATVSVGVAAAPAASDIAKLFAEADRAVYRAKAAGRDCVRLAEPAAPVETCRDAATVDVAPQRRGAVAA